MEHQKILDLLIEPNYSKFVTRKCNIVSDQSNANYDVGNKIMYNTWVLKPNLCDYNDAYILVKGDITVTTAPATQVSFKNCAPYTKRVTKIDGTTIYDSEDLDLVTTMYNLREHSSNYSETSESLWFYSEYEATNLIIILKTLMVLNFASIRLNYWETQLLRLLQM